MRLAWFHPTISGIIVAILLGENFVDFDKSSTPLFHYSYCSKTEMQSFAINMLSMSSMAIVFLTVLTHIFLFKRQRQLRKQKVDGTIVISFINEDGISIKRRPADTLLCQKLSRHERTVVTPKASQFSFIVHCLFIPLTGIVFHTADSSGLHFWPLWVQFFFFTIISQAFVLNNIVETIFSPHLCSSLFDLFLLNRHTCPVINV